MVLIVNFAKFWVSVVLHDDTVTVVMEYTVAVILFISLGRFTLSIIVCVSYLIIYLIFSLCSWISDPLYLFSTIWLRRLL